MVALKHKGMLSIQENNLLSTYTTFKTGGPARFFAEVSNDTEMVSAISFARKRDLPVFFLGSGSNSLVSDRGFLGLVIKVMYRGVSCEPISDSRIRLLVGAGEVWDDVVSFSVKKGLWGIENLSGIPGTVGGAVVGNIGAYGEEVKDTLDFVTTYDCLTGEEKIFSANEISLSYRSSFFKSKEGRRYVVVSAAFQLSTKGKPSIEYKDLALYFREKTPSSIEEVREAVLSIRAAKLPDWRQVPTVGSYFKNPRVTSSVYETLKVRFPEIPPARNEEGVVKISAAWLLDKVCGLKGFTLGNVSTHDRQALVVITNGKATSKEIFMFGEMISKKVFDATGIILEREVELIGDF